MALFGDRRSGSDGSATGREREELRIFHNVARALTSNLELEPLLRVILAQMESFFGPERWTLLMVDERTDELFLALASNSTSRTPRPTARLRMGEGLAGYVARTGEPLVIPDIRQNSEWSRFADQHPELNLHSIACFPLRAGGRTLGVLQMHNSRLSEAQQDTAISFIRVLCDYAGIALQNARQLREVHRLTITDDCTRLFNSRHLYNSIAAQIEQVQGDLSRHFSLLFVDLDRFKSINDTHGHLVGSRLLAEVGTLFQRALGPNNPGFRYGGDEFVALLIGLDKPEAIKLSEQVRDRIREAPLLPNEGLNLHLTASMGLATFPQDGPDQQSIIRAADTMMYQAKANGRDRLEIAGSGIPLTVTMAHTSRHADSLVPAEAFL